MCNAAETLVVHEEAAAALLPGILAELAEAGVELHADERARAVAREAGVPTVELADGDVDTEWNALVMSVVTVPSLDAAVAHVRAHGTAHTEVIVTEDRAAARRWTNEVDAAAVVVNASSRFTDGGEFGFGAEIGISTQKLHARGPMALPELTSTKWIVEGDGQVR